MISRAVTRVARERDSGRDVLALYLQDGTRATLDLSRGVEGKLIALLIDHGLIVNGVPLTQLVATHQDVTRRARRRRVGFCP